MKKNLGRLLNIIVGGFYGDEGKGKIIGFLAIKDNPDYVIRVGGPQAGHTVTEGIKVRQIPAGLINSRCYLLIARGSIIDPRVVLEEIELHKVEGRIGIDFGCTVVNPHHLEQEAELVERIGSVGTGVGPARVDRILRVAGLAKDVPELKPYLVDTAKIINSALKSGKRVLVEGTQGYGLSLLDYHFYPWVTSQDTTASQFAADIGVGPRAVNEVTVIYKAYTSRVAAGPINFEWTEEEKQRRGIEERGTVSGRIRRLGDFDRELAVKSFSRNTGTQAAITCVDRLFKGNSGVREFDKLTREAQDFIKEIDSLLKEVSIDSRGVTLISTGPNTEDTIDLR